MNKRKTAKNIDEQVKQPPLKLERPPKIESTPGKFWEKSDGKIHFESDPDRHKDFKEMIGVKDSDIAEHILVSGTQALHAYGRGQTEGANLVLQSANDQGPKDAIEARLITQAAALYANGMDYLSKANKASDIRHMEIYANLSVKLIRLHNESVEAFCRYRRGGEQKVVVQHVNVSDGGKAIVSGNLQMGEGGRDT